jgi:hypothetical protein
MVGMLIPMLFSSMFAQFAAIAPSERGTDLYHSCQADIRLLDGVSTSQEDIHESLICHAFIGGFLDGIEFANKLICANGSTMGTVVRVYVVYMGSHPREMDEYKVVGLYRALAQTYPCPKQE